MESILYLRIKELCAERGITMAKLEEDLGIGTSLIRKWKTNTSPSNDENAADLNRIWDVDQNITSIYSSAYNPDYQTFRHLRKNCYRMMILYPCSEQNQKCQHKIVKK